MITRVRSCQGFERRSHPLALVSLFHRGRPIPDADPFEITNGTRINAEPGWAECRGTTQVPDAPSETCSGSPMIVYYLDAQVATLRLETIDANAFHGECCRLIGCDTIDQIEVGDDQIAHFDDHALLRPAKALWTAQRERTPMMAGNAVFTGNGGPGGYSAPLRSPQEFADNLRVFRPVIAAGSVHDYDPRTFTGIMFVVAAGIGEFRLTLEESPVSFEAPAESISGMRGLR